MKNARFSLIFRQFVASASAAACLATGAASLAHAGSWGPAAPAGPSLSELRDAERFAESQHTRKLREIEEGLQAQILDADSALMKRGQVEAEYKREMEGYRRAEENALRELEAAQRPKAAGEQRAPTSAAAPRFQSQSVISYPQGTGGATEEPVEKPHREGDQKNVGFGTRELSF